MVVAIGDIVRITAKMRLFGTDDVQNVFTYKVDRQDAADDTVFMVSAALHLDVAYTLLNARISTFLAYVSVDGFNITQNVLLPDTPWPILTAGTNANDLLPTQVAACVFWPTTTPKVRGSSFFGGLCVNSNVVDGSVSAGAVADLVLVGAALRAWSTASVDCTKGTFNPIGSIFTPAGVASVPVRWRTQRRRRLGVGS